MQEIGGPGLMRVFSVVEHQPIGQVAQQPDLVEVDKGLVQGAVAMFAVGVHFGDLSQVDPSVILCCCNSMSKSFMNSEPFSEST